jgi:small-conductance mechanosensitive channel
MKIKIIILTCLFGMGIGLDAAEGILKIVTDRIGRPEEVLELESKQRQGRLEDLQKEKAQLETAKSAFLTELQVKMNEIEKKLGAIRQALQLEPDNEFLIKVQSLLNDWLQILKEQQKTNDVIIADFDERITQLTEYLKDPNFKNFERTQKSAGIIGHSFENLQNLNQKIIELKKTVDFLTEQEKATAEEYKNKKRYLAGVKEAYKNKKEELAGVQTVSNEPFGMSARQKGELLILEEKFYHDKMVLEEMRLKDIDNKHAAISMNSMTAKVKLDILKNILAKEKSSLKVTELDIYVAKDDLAKRKQQVDARVAALQKEIDQFDTKDSILQETSKRYGIPLTSDLDDWKVEPSKNIDKIIALFEVGLVNDQSLVARREKDLLEARKALELEQIDFEVLQVDIQDSYYRATMRKFKSEAGIDTAIKKYKGTSDDVVAKTSECVNKRKSFVAMAADQRKALETLHNREREIRQLKETVFRSSPNAYARVLDLLHSVQALVKRQIKIIDEIVSMYDDMLAKLTAKSLQLNFIIDELENIKWYRSQYAITLKDIKNIGTDMGRFFKDVGLYLRQVNLKALFMTIIAVFDTPLAWLLFIVKLILMIAAALMLRKLVPAVANGFISMGKSYRGLRMLSLFFACMAGYFVRYFSFIAPWLIIYSLGMMYSIPDPFVAVIFYLLSIPYWIFLANRFVNYFIDFNEQNNYVFISEEFKLRFFPIFSVLLYSTISIFLFREAFLLLNYVKSEFPTILLAINVIILQISLILMLGKDQILHIIPTQTSLGEWIYKQVDTYYNLILFGVVTLIVLSNPYVGYGTAIVRMVVRIAATALLIQALIIAQNFFKRTIASFFFSMNEETVKERFTYAKTWYGVFIVLTTIAFVVFAIVVCAKLWQWPEALAKISKWDDIKNWLTTPILMERSEHPISVFSVLQIFSFIFGGLLLAFIFDKFILHRMFDVLLVEHGVQNAISSLTRFGIIIIAFILGIQTVGLGAQVSYFLAALLLGVGWVIKDPAYDLISYFIILIQRPVKIGDYVRFDEDIRGVVRRITPRSVVLRRRNSATIIVPNSQIMSRSFANWNYGRGFIAFDDIFITVDYQEDPQKVQTILTEVLTSSPHILKSPAPIVRLYRFGAYGFVFQIRGYLSSSYTLDMWEIAAEIRMGIATRLRKNNITIASMRASDATIGSVPGSPSPRPIEFPDHMQTDE